MKTIMRRSHVLQAIADDTISFMSLLLGLQKHAKFPLLVPGILPPLAMYVIESHRVLKQLVPEWAYALDEEMTRHLSATRKHAKMLDDQSKSVEQVAWELVEVAGNQTRYYMDPHTGTLASLKQALQPDLGLSTYNGHIFSTTHFSASIFGWDIGMSEDEMGKKALNVGKAISFYTSILLRLLSLNEPEPAPAYLLDGIISMRDIKAPSIYARGSLGQLPEEFSIAATTLLSSLNHVQYIMRPVLPENSLTEFKLKLICAFHADSNLRYIQNRIARNSSLDNVKQLLREAIGNADSRWLRKQRSLRNLLVHYLDGSPPPASSPAARNRQAVIEQLGKATLTHMNELLDRHISRMSRLIESGFELEGEPFWYGSVD